MKIEPVKEYAMNNFESKLLSLGESKTYAISPDIPVLYVAVVSYTYTPWYAYVIGIGQWVSLLALIGSLIYCLIDTIICKVKKIERKKPIKLVITFLILFIAFFAAYFILDKMELMELNRY